MAYRKYIKPNPFEASKRNIELKLHHIEEQILNKFPSGKQRELMRRTIQQMLENEQSIQCKIKKLINLVDSFEPVQLRTSYTDKPEQEEEDYSFPRYDRQNLYRSVNNRQPLDLKNPLSHVSRCSSDLKGSFSGKKFYTQNEEQASKISQSFVQSHNSPFSQLSSHKNYSDIIQYNDNEPKRQPSDLKLVDSINEKDIFSFRTQKGELSPNEASLKYTTKAPVSPSNSKVTKKERKSRQKSPLKQSIAYTEKSSKSRSHKSKSKKKINYDGFSYTYQPSKSQSQLHKSQYHSTLTQSLDPTHLYKNISTRIKVSPCVIDRLAYSTSSASLSNLSSRHALELQVRSSLIPLLCSPL